MSGWALLPLRAFLGITFCFAGLQKLANPNFFNANNPSGIQAQLIASTRLSPLHSLMGHLIHLASPLGVLIALSELAVGLGILVGLWTRVAAAGGLLLSLTLFLTISFHSSPYYTGADIVFFFAWIPLILAGAGGVLSLDALIAARTRHEAGLGPSFIVPVQFGVIQQVCGNYDDDRCVALNGDPCEVHRCPFLRAGDPKVASGQSSDVDRRTVVLGGAAAAALGLAGLAGAGAVIGISRAAGGTTPPSGGGTVSLPTHRSPAVTAPTTTPTQQGTATTVPKVSGTAIGEASAVPVGGAARFSDPSTGDPSLVLQLSAGKFVAYDAVCPHAGCTVGWSSAADLIVCPCHGSEFDPNNGHVVQGPAPHGLAQIGVSIGPNGQLYVRR